MGLQNSPNQQTQNGLTQPMNGLTNGLNGLSHHHQPQPSQQTAALGNPSSGSYLSLADKQSLLLLHQTRQLEDQLFNLNFKCMQQQQQQQGFGSSLGGVQSFMGNSDLLTNNTDRTQQQQSYHQFGGLGHLGLGNKSRHSEADLDFDPFQETQKALAELMETEQAHLKLHSGGHGPLQNTQSLNGLIHGQSNSHIPPPPPGFVGNNNTHMNSFGK